MCWFDIVYVSSAQTVVVTPFGVTGKCCGFINSTKFENKKYYNASLKQISNVNANDISQRFNIVVYKNIIIFFILEQLSTLVYNICTSTTGRTDVGIKVNCQFQMVSTWSRFVFISNLVEPFLVQLLRS